MTAEPGSAVGLRPWRFVIAFGIVSLLADVVYEGARSITGPLLASLGASAAVVGFVTGAGEAAAWGLRLASGPLADRTGRLWAWTLAGYVITVVSVPVLGLAGALGAACALVVAERVGKAVRSPAKDTLLSHATAATGRGRGFAVHEALDQTGALVGPLIVAGVLYATGGDYAPALGVLAAPGIAAVGLLVWLRGRVPDPLEAYETPVVPRRLPQSGRKGRLPRAFWLYAAFSGTTTSGLATFGVLSYHLDTRHLLSPAAVPVLYAGAMLTAGLAALATGFAYDRVGARAVIVLPLLTAAVPALAFTRHLPSAAVGALLWGAALGVQESTMRAVVADLVPTGRRATAYGVIAGILGAAGLIGGALTGVLYTVSVPLLVTVVAALQAAALVLLAAARITSRTRITSGTGTTSGTG
ncbi:MFS transporter [Streptomyces sp. NPDC056061]|uniref:MFS transporter n=1 Tax=Streptomyces sp. NPDC056061 TaxID=3345700 RepID=UPI0035E09CA7